MISVDLLFIFKRTKFSIYPSRGKDGVSSVFPVKDDMSLKSKSCVSSPFLEPLPTRSTSHLRQTKSSFFYLIDTFLAGVSGARGFIDGEDE